MFAAVDITKNIGDGILRSLYRFLCVIACLVIFLVSSFQGGPGVHALLHSMEHECIIQPSDIHSVHGCHDHHHNRNSDGGKHYPGRSGNEDNDREPRGCNPNLCLFKSIHQGMLLFPALVPVGVPVTVGDLSRVIPQFQTLFHSHLLSPCQGRAPPLPPFTFSS